jgi:hypothetical protein
MPVDKLVVDLPVGNETNTAMEKNSRFGHTSSRMIYRTFQDSFYRVRYQEGTPEKLVTFSPNVVSIMRSSFFSKSSSSAIFFLGVRNSSIAAGAFSIRMAERSP